MEEQLQEAIPKNIGTLLNEYATVQMLLAPLQEQAKELREAIKAHVMESGIDRADSGMAEVKYVPSYIRTTWDSKALKGYAVDHPELNQFCKATPVSATVKITVRK